MTSTYHDSNIECTLMVHTPVTRVLTHRLCSDVPVIYLCRFDQQHWGTPIHVKECLATTYALVPARAAGTPSSFADHGTSSLVLTMPFPPSSAPVSILAGIYGLLTVAHDYEIALMRTALLNHYISIPSGVVCWETMYSTGNGNNTLSQEISSQ